MHHLCSGSWSDFFIRAGCGWVLHVDGRGSTATALTAVASASIAFSQRRRSDSRRCCWAWLLQLFLRARRWFRLLDPLGSVRFLVFVAYHCCQRLEVEQWLRVSGCCACPC